MYKLRNTLNYKQFFSECISDSHCPSATPACDAGTCVRKFTLWAVYKKWKKVIETINKIKKILRNNTTCMLQKKVN